MSLVGTSVGHIRILGDLGRGGMGDVYVGVDERLQRRVALKAIRPEYRLDPVARARFLREARMLSQLDDPHICRIYDYIEGDAADFLVLELIDGRTLTSDVIASLTRPVRFGLAEQIVSVLVTAHGRGIVHRDLKPGNLMLNGEGSIKVLDFGLARTVVPEVDAESAIAAAPSDTSVPVWFDSESDTRAAAAPAGVVDAAVTLKGAVSGSAAYMSPEQARGEPLTTASDMYSFGLVLQELFTGRPPQPLDLPVLQLIGRAARGDSLPVQGLSADLTFLIERLKSLAPAARPTAVETADRLRSIREKPRRRIRQLVAAAAIVLLAAGGLKYTLDLRAAHGEAERRRAQAEDLIAFMLGDLRERLEPVGRLAILDAVGAKALAYFDSLPPEAQSDEELMRRARALSQIGEVRVATGNAEGAIAALAESLVLARRGVERQPTRTDWLKTLGATHFWIGYAHLNRNEFDGALREFTAYREIAGRMVALEPSRAEWQLELAQAESNLGSLHHVHGRFAEAERHFTSAVTVKRSLAEAEPENPRWQRELAGSLSWLGEAAYRQGRARAALQHYEANAAILARLTSLHPDNTEWRFLRAISHTKVSMVLRHLGRAAESLAENAHCEALLRSLVAHDPLNAEWKRELAVALVASARTLLALDRPAEALQSAGEAGRLLAQLLARDASNADWRRSVAATEFVTGAAHLARGGYAPALAAIERGHAALAPLASDTADAVAARYRAEGYLLEADVREATGNVRAGRQVLSQALAAIAPIAEGSTRADLLWVHAQALIRLGLGADAVPIVQRLTAQEFRPLEYTRFCKLHRCEGGTP